MIFNFTTLLIKECEKQEHKSCSIWEVKEKWFQTKKREEVSSDSKTGNKNRKIFHNKPKPLIYSAKHQTYVKTVNGTVRQRVANNSQEITDKEHINYNLKAKVTSKETPLELETKRVIQHISSTTPLQVSADECTSKPVHEEPQQDNINRQGSFLEWEVNNRPDRNRNRSVNQKF